MSGDQLTLEILTPSGALRLEGQTAFEVPGVEVPGILGELGLLPRHIPFVTALRPGVVRFRLGAASHRVVVGTGFVEVSEAGRVSILTDRAAWPEEVEPEAARKELAEVRERLRGLEEYALDAPDHRELRDREAWLEAQLRVAGS